jgi:alpha-tubulin suppressor-like RCC1 family protein
MPGETKVVQLVAGSGHSCALHEDGSVTCWGFNGSGQLGTGTTFYETKAPAAVKALGKAVLIAAGGNVSCAVVEDASLWCWGEGLQLRQVAAGAHPKPVKVDAVEEGASFALGSGHICVLRQAGALECWGGSEHAALGTFAVGG